ncbi:MAG: chaperone modulator CbpM [Bacteroidota bacterium]
MLQSKTIAAEVFCLNYKIDYNFLQKLHDYGVIETSNDQEEIVIPEEQLPILEKMVRLHVDMDINAEGIETIYFLLQKIEKMQQEITQLQNKLAFYES